MKISEERLMQAYRAVRGPIVDLRVDLLNERYQGTRIDHRIAQLELQIWHGIKKALNINEGK